MAVPYHYEPATCALEHKIDSRTNIGEGSHEKSDVQMHLADRMKQPYSFKKDKVTEIFHLAERCGLQLPPCKRPYEAGKFNHPYFCLYHRIIGHKTEDCWVFKNWVERAIKKNRITLPAAYLQHPALHEQSIRQTRVHLVRPQVVQKRGP